MYPRETECASLWCHQRDEDAGINPVDAGFIRVPTCNDRFSLPCQDLVIEISVIYNSNELLYKKIHLT